jgi:hypothetical protein
LLVAFITSGGGGALSVEGCEGGDGDPLFFSLRGEVEPMGRTEVGATSDPAWRWVAVVERQIGEAVKHGGAFG